MTSAFFSAALLPFALLMWALPIAAQTSFVQIRDIALYGLERTRPGVVLREMILHKGDSLPASALDSALVQCKNNIYNLGLFNAVEVGHTATENQVVVSVTVKERWYVFPLPYVASEERSSYDFINTVLAREIPRISYGAVLVWRNVFGNNETLNFFGQTGFSQRLTVTFTRPALFPRQNIDCIAQVKYISKRSTIYTTDSAQALWARMETAPVQRYQGASLLLRKRFTPRTNAYAKLQYRHFLLHDSLFTFAYGSEFLTRARHTEAYADLTIGYENDRRDLKTFPLHGYRLHLVARGAGLGSVSFLKVGLAWAQHLQLARRWYAAWGVQSFVTAGQHLPFIEKNFLGLETDEFQGYNDVLRGYEPYTIAGTGLHTLKGEVKYALIPYRMVHFGWVPLKKFQDLPIGLYLTSYVDGGYVHDATATSRDAFLRDTPLLGYGLGLNMVGPYDLTGRIEYSRNHLGQSGVYIHMIVSVP